MEWRRIAPRFALALTLTPLAGCVSTARLLAAAVPDAQVSAEDYYERGRARAARDDFQGALEDYSRALQTNPKLVGAWIDRAISRFWLEDYEAMRDDLDQALALDSTQADAYYWRGVAYARLRNDASAELDYNEALRLNPRIVNAYRERANVRSRLGDYSGAVADYTAVLQANPNASSAYFNRGVPYRYALLAYGQMADDEESVRLDLEFLLSLFGRGPALMRLGDFQAAIEDLTMAQRLEPTSLGLHTRGVARYYLGDLPGAIADFDQAIEQDAKQLAAVDMKV